MNMQNYRAVGLVAVVLLAGVNGANANDWPQWRGLQRDGISAETGLLKTWPKEGPKLLWQVKNLGSGYSTPAVVGDRLFALGNEGLDNEFVQALSVKDGGKIWTTRLGKVGNPDQQPKFPAARSTPTVDGELLYALSSDGDLACVETGSGKIRWQKSLRADFGGKPGTWAYSESPLIDGERVICTPGGSQATLVALDKKTGNVIWKAPVPGGEEASYASVIVVELGGVKQYVQLLQKGLVGVAANTGKLLWRYDRTAKNSPAVIPTPVADKGYIYSAGARVGGGLVQLKIKGESAEVEQVYFSPKLPAEIGGTVLRGNYLYGTAGPRLVCVDFATGQFKWDERGLGPASVCYADDHLYLHTEDGEVALVEATAEGFHEKGRFTPPDAPAHATPMEKAWAYPIVANGRLYIRDLGTLWCYAVR